MQYTILSTAALIAVGLLSGCTSSAEKSEDAPNRVETVSNARDHVKTQMKKTAQAMENYTYAQKAEFVTATKKELSDIKTEMDRLSDKVAGSDDETRTSAEIKLTAMQKAWAQTNEQLNQAESVTEDAWNDVKQNVRKSRDGLKESFEQTRQWLSDKIEP